MVVDRLLERQKEEAGGKYPESIAVVLWGTDNIKTYGESLAQVRCFPCCASPVGGDCVRWQLAVALDELLSQPPCSPSLSVCCLPRRLPAAPRPPAHTSKPPFQRPCSPTHPITQVCMMVGVKPVPDALGRVNKLEVIPLEELKRPRVDVVVNCSGVFRDLFVNQVGAGAVAGAVG